MEPATATSLGSSYAPVLIGYFLCTGIICAFGFAALRNRREQETQTYLGPRHDSFRRAFHFLAGGFLFPLSVLVGLAVIPLSIVASRLEAGATRKAVAKPAAHEA